VLCSCELRGFTIIRAFATGEFLGRKPVRTLTGEQNMQIFVTDPIRLLTPNDPRTVGLHEVFAHAHNGSLTDLSALRSDQRAPVVTACAARPVRHAPGGQGHAKAVVGRTSHVSQGRGRV